MIYLDNAATTSVYSECFEPIKKYGEEIFFNPSALYSEASAVAHDIKAARENLLRHLNGVGGSLIFTASGTEADNLAFHAKAFKKGSKLIISAVEHAAVYRTAAAYKQQGFEIAVCPTDRFGKVDPQKFAEIADENTAFVSVIHVSNETGAVNDIAEIARIAKKKNPDCIVHSDGVQGFKKASLNLLKSEIDLYSISGHKIHAPKGIGALYVKKGLNLRAFIHGGGQENNIRSATENVAGIAAFSLAADLISKKIIDKNLLRGLRDALTENFDVKINTPSEDIDRILSVAFRGIRGEVLLHSLEKHGIIVGTGSACSSQKGGTRIADALGLPKEYGAGILRISINENTSREEIGFFLEKLTLEYCNLLNYIG